MNALFVTLRAVHFATALLLFGEMVFALCVAGRSAEMLRQIDVLAHEPPRALPWGHRH